MASPGRDGIQDGEVTHIDIPQLVAAVEVALTLGGVARHHCLLQSAGREPFMPEVPPRAVRCLLSGIAGPVEVKRVEVDTQTTGCLQLEPRRALIQRLAVTKGLEGGEDLVLAGGVEVDVDVLVVPGLPAGQGVDPPASRQPVAATAREGPVQASTAS